MGEHSPWRDPGGWFLDLAIGVLIGILALTIAVHLLTQILPWLAAMAVVAVVIWIGVLVVRTRSRRW